MSADVENMFSVREKPWHELGIVIKDAPTSEDALRLAGLVHFAPFSGRKCVLERPLCGA